MKCYITGTSSSSIQPPLVPIERNTVRSEERRQGIVAVVVVIARPKGSSDESLLNATGSRKSQAFGELSSASTTPPGRFEGDGLSGISAAVGDGHASSDEPGA